MSDGPEPDDEPDHWFEPLAEHLGRAYLRYSFTKGTVQEVDALVGWLGLEPGMRVLDVGCGPGRHVHEFARRGIACHGVDISQRFVDLGNETAPAGASFERLDARKLVARCLTASYLNHYHYYLPIQNVVQDTYGYFSYHICPPPSQHEN